MEKFSVQRDDDFIKVVKGIVTVGNTEGEAKKICDNKPGRTAVSTLPLSDYLTYVLHLP